MIAMKSRCIHETHRHYRRRHLRCTGAVCCVVRAVRLEHGADKVGAGMTPKEYLKLRDTIQASIDTLRKAMYDAAELAEASPLPENLRPANADDIKPGALIWYKHGDDGHFWQVVSEPRFYGDAFKAYTAEDGSRYGLDDAWIEVDA